MKRGITPEQEIAARHFAHLGPVSGGLLTRVASERWGKALKGASRMAEEAVKEQPGLRFEQWGKDLGTRHDLWNDKSEPDS